MHNPDAVSTSSTSASDMSTMPGTSTHLVEDPPPVSAHPAPTGATVVTAPVQANMPGKILLVVDRDAKFEVDQNGAFVIKAGSPVTVITTPDLSSVPAVNNPLGGVPSPSSIVSHPDASEHGDNNSAAAGNAASDTSTNAHVAALESKIKRIHEENGDLLSVVHDTEDALQATRHQLLATQDQLRAAQDKLHATEDDLAIVTTELHAAKDQLQTFKDESHDIKEKLVADIDNLKVVNLQLRMKSDTTLHKFGATKANLQATKAELHSLKVELESTKAELYKARNKLGNTNLALPLLRPQQLHAPPAPRPLNNSANALDRPPYRQ